MAVRVVVDSSAGLPPELAREHDITVLDLHVMEKQGKDQETSTSGLSALELAAAYARQLERGGDDGVVALHLSKQLSATHTAAVTASGIFEDTVRVVDTGSAGMAIGAAAIAAASAAAEGASLDECEARAIDTLAHSETWVYLQRLDDIRKSGRMSTGTALMSAALLAIKPIMRVVDGKVELAGKTRTQTKAFAKLVELVVERAGEEPAFVAIQHVEAEEEAEELRDMLAELLADGSRFLVAPLPQALAIHVGQGAVGVSGVFASSGEEEEDTDSE